MVKHRRIPALDGIRGFAAAWIFFFHYLPGQHSSSPVLRLLWEYNQVGWVAVSLFFVLSGFLISGILWDSFGDKHWWRNFYIRRSVRIFPLYYLALFLGAALYLAFGAPAAGLKHLLVDVFYLQDVPPLFAFRGIPLYNGVPVLNINHLWSLAVEEQFYMLWPAVLFCFMGRRRLAMKVTAGLFLLSFVFRLMLHPAGAPEANLWAGEFLAGRCGELFAGAFLALLIREEPAVLEKVYRYIPWIFGGSFLLLLAIMIGDRTPELTTERMFTLGLVLWAIFFACLILLALRPGTVASIFEWGFLRWLGTISYGLYVYHLLLRPLFEVVAHTLTPHASRNVSAVVLLLVAIVGTLAAAVPSFYFFEKPMLRFKRGTTVPESTAAPESEAASPTLPRTV